MAHSFTVTGPTWRESGGVKSVSWQVTELEVAAASEWKIPLPAKLRLHPLTMTLFYARKTAGSAATVQSKIGTVTNPTSGAAGYLDQISAAAAAVRGFEDVRIEPGAEAIFGRSTPNTGSDNTVVTDVTVILGHFA